jgi:hypothetical protein
MNSAIALSIKNFPTAKIAIVDGIENGELPTSIGNKISWANKK